MPVGLDPGYPEPSTTAADFDPAGDLTLATTAPTADLEPTGDLPTASRARPRRGLDRCDGFWGKIDPEKQGKSLIGLERFMRNPL